MRSLPLLAVALLALALAPASPAAEDRENTFVARLAALADKNGTYQVNAGPTSPRMIVTKPGSSSKRKIMPLVVAIDGQGRFAVNRGPAREVVDLEEFKERLDTYAAAARLGDGKPRILMVVQPASKEAAIQRVLSALAHERIRVLELLVVEGDRKQDFFPRRTRKPRIIPRPVPPGGRRP